MQIAVHHCQVVEFPKRITLFRYPTFHVLMARFEMHAFRARMHTTTKKFQAVCYKPYSYLSTVDYWCSPYAKYHSDTTKF